MVCNTSLAAVRAVFDSQEEALGRPEGPTKAGFLALARAGRGVWNLWRAHYPTPRPDFSKVDFLSEPIDFSGFLFATPDTQIATPDGYRVGVDFAGAMFGDNAMFTGAEFGNFARFMMARFGNGASFEGAQFGFFAMLAKGLVFGQQVGGPWLGHDASFDGAQFGGWAQLGAQFEGQVSFMGAQFGDMANFGDARFCGLVQFDARDRKQVEARWREICADKEAVDRRKKLAEDLSLRSDAFLKIDFCGAWFKAYASFQNREFLGRTDFRGARFDGVPAFHGCKLHQDTSFDDVNFYARPMLETVRAYRTLKLAMAQQHAIREEQRFFRLEMKTEAALAKGSQSVLFVLYEALSDFGFSLWRPFFFWLGCIVAFGAVDGILSGPSALQAGIDWSRTLKWGQYVLINAVPLPGFDHAQMDLRTDLFGTGGKAFVAVVLDMAHRICALAAFFLVGLALRNLFKMKG